jgi:hypothetical protein
VDRRQLYDRAQFWLLLGTALAIVGGILIGVGAPYTESNAEPLGEHLVHRWGAAVVIGVLMWNYAVVLYLAHGPAQRHMCPDPDAHRTPIAKEVSRGVREVLEAERSPVNAPEAGGKAPPQARPPR